jgi:hypothetical protein
MRLGVVCEGEKSDGPVLEMLLKAEFPAVALEIVATSKAVIFSAVGTLVDEMLAGGCDRVVIAWDLHPVGAQMSVKSQTEHPVPCQRDQRKTLLAAASRQAQACQGDVRSLQHRYGFRGDGDAAGEERVCLVCFCESFDAVFLSDVKFLQELASSEIREAEAPSAVRSPITVKSPQQFIRQYFRRGHNKRLKYFNKYEHNIVLAREFIEQRKLRRLRQHPGYHRLVTVVAQWIAASAGRRGGPNVLRR